MDSISLQDLLRQFREALLAVGQKLQSTARAAKPQSSQHIVTSEQLSQISEAISMELTKASLLLSGNDPVQVSTVHPLLDGIEKHFIVMMQAHDLLCLTSSTSLLKVVTLVFSEVVNSSVHLVDELLKGTTTAKCAPVLGVVWAACKTMGGLVLDNKRAVVHDVELVTCTMKDAVRELQEAIDSSGNNASKNNKDKDDDDDELEMADTLSFGARSLAIPTLQLMKAACNVSSSLEKLFAPLTQTPADIECMEVVLECVRRLGMEIDEIAVALYECTDDDENLKEVLTNVKAFHTTAAKLVSILLSNPSLQGQTDALKRLEVTNGVLNQAMAACKAAIK